MSAFRVTVVITGFMFSSLLWAAPAMIAGTVSLITGGVIAIAPNGSTRSLAKDAPVHSGDRILTSPASYVRLAFQDGGSMVLRPNTEFIIEAFRFQSAQPESKALPTLSGVAPAPILTVAKQPSSSNQAFFRLIRGGFRAVSGLVGKINRAEYAVRTPVATIGIRGTEFLSVFCDALCAADNTVLSSLPPGQTALGGMVSGVDQGSIVVVSNVGQAAVIQPAHFVLTTASGVQVTLPALPGFIASETWLGVAQAVPAGAASTPAAAVAPGSHALVGSVLTFPTISGLAAAALIGTVALVTGQTEDAEPSSTTSTTPQTLTGSGAVN